MMEWKAKEDDEHLEQKDEVVQKLKLQMPDDICCGCVQGGTFEMSATGCRQRFSLHRVKNRRQVSKTLLTRSQFGQWEARVRRALTPCVVQEEWVIAPPPTHSPCKSLSGRPRNETAWRMATSCGNSTRCGRSPLVGS